MTNPQALDDFSRHLSKLNDEVGELEQRAARIEADVAWLKTLQLLILGGVLGNSLFLILQLLR